MFAHDSNIFSTVMRKCELSSVNCHCSNAAEISKDARTVPQHGLNREKF